MTGNELIASLAKEGLYAYVIGSKFGLKAVEIIDICNKQGVEVNSKSNQANRKRSRIKQLLLSGNYTQREICETVGCEPIDVRQARHQLGIVQTYPHREEIRKKYRKKSNHAAVLVQHGMTIKDACQAVGISQSTYHKYINNHQ